MTHVGTVRLIHLDQFLQAAEVRRQLLALGADAAAPIGERDFADIDIAARVDGQPVRRDELTGVEPGMGMTEPRPELALARITADPRAAIPHVQIDRHYGPDI